MAVKTGALSAATIYGRTDEGSTALYETVRAIKALPSAQPEKRTEERTETHACDLISRQAALDAIDKYILGKPEGDTVEVRELLKLIAKIYRMPSAQPQPQWIPVTEKLPERDKNVLVTRDYDGRADHIKSCRYVEVASCYGEDDDVSWNSYSDEYKMTPKNHRVVAWMSLPEPWKG